MRTLFETKCKMYRKFIYTMHGVHTAEVAEKEGSKLLGRQEYAKRVALDLYRFMEARTTCCACCCDVVACD